MHAGTTSVVTTRLLAGVGRTCITPSLAVPHAGWGAQTHLLADGVHRDLYVTVLLLGHGDDGATPITAWVEFDLVGLYGLDVPVAERVAAETGLAPEQVRVSVTHNHANPVMWENWIGGRPDEVTAYRASLPSAAAGAARAALLDLTPVRVASGVGRCEVGRNRRQTIAGDDGGPRVIVGRDDEGVRDPEVTVVRFDTLDGTPHAAVLGYTCHPTTLGPDNRLHSPDYPGVAKETFAAATGARTLFAQGAAGNVGPRLGFVGDVDVVEALGRELGLAAAATWATLDPRPVQATYLHPRESGATLATWEERALPERPVVLATEVTTVALPLRPQPPLEEAIADYDRWQRELARVHAEKRPAPEIEATMFRARRAQMAVTRVRTYGGRSTILATLRGLRIGDAAFLACNGEPFCEIGLAVKETSPFATTAFGGYTGAALGYLPWPSAYDEGGYEVETTPYDREAAALLVEAARDMLERLAAA